MSPLNQITRIACAAAVFAYTASGHARGVSPYLPLNMSPEIERDIEAALLLAGKSVMKRPIAAASVLDALPEVCLRDGALCRRVRAHLDRYTKKIGVAHASATISTSDGADYPLPNLHGMTTDSAWRVSGRAYWQANDHVLVNLGGVAYDGEAMPTDSLLSVGFQYAQLDIGYRDHWLSPFTSSAMAISSNAKTLPSVTVSNYTPIGSLGISYEVFLAEMGQTEAIAFEDGYASGKPRMAGLHIGVEPAAGWSLSANRLMQFGGGPRGGRSFGDFIDALFKPHQTDNRSADLGKEEEFGNQVAAWTSRFSFPGRTPFAAYLEYAGEDNSYEGNFRLGNAALSIGLTFPQLWDRFDLTYETSEWQNGWYVHGIYQEGLTEEGRVLGHWGADHREFLDGVGAQSHMLRLGWRLRSGGLAQMQVRTVANESYTGRSYERAYDVAVAYSHALFGWTAGAELMAGQDVFGDSFSRLSGFVRLGDDWWLTARSGHYDSTEPPQGAHVFIDGGANYSRVLVRLGDGSPKRETSYEAAPHIAVGARRAVSSRSDLGVRAELDRVDGELFFAVRALDYRYKFSHPLALSVFVGAARYDLATPAYGYYVGGGLQWRDIFPNVDLGIDLRYADKVARDKLLPSDPGSDLRPDSFYDVQGMTVSLSYRF